MRSLTVLSSIRRTLVRRGQQARITDTEQLNITMDMGIDEFPISIPIDFSNRSLQYNMEIRNDETGNDFWHTRTSSVRLSYEPSGLDCIRWTARLRRLLSKEALGHGMS